VRVVTGARGQFAKVEAELCKAAAAAKCWRCGCFQDTVAAFEQSSTVRAALSSLLEEARVLFQERRYDCLGCEVCWPAVATNAAAEVDPAVAEANHCPAEEAEPREGWPPLPGEYRVLRCQAPVAVCTLNSDELIGELANARFPHIAVVGSLHTENLGIERIIRNVLPNPCIRFLIVCGEDTRRAIGHLPGQSLLSLFAGGLDERLRICGARGKRPVIKNVAVEDVEFFRRHIEVIDCIGEIDPAAVLASVERAAERNPGLHPGVISDTSPIRVGRAQEPRWLVSDPSGYLVIYPDYRKGRLVLEHYTNKGVLDRVIEGATTTALYATVIEAGLISRLDHAAYLGRELARAEYALLTGAEYVQDRAPGDSSLV
jgi:tetrahydromethanopterin S-methyltransferase subunit A